MGGFHRNSDAQKSKRQNTSRNMPDRTQPVDTFKTAQIVRAPSKGSIKTEQSAHAKSKVGVSGSRQKSIEKESTRVEPVKEVTKMPTKKEKSVEAVSKVQSRPEVQDNKATEQAKETQPTTTAMGKKKMGGRRTDNEAKEVEVTKHGKKRMMPTRTKEYVESAPKKVPEQMLKALPPNLSDFYIDDPRAVTNARNVVQSSGQMGSDSKTSNKETSNPQNKTRASTKSKNQSLESNGRTRSGGKDAGSGVILKQNVGASGGITDTNDIKYLMSKLRQPKIKSKENSLVANDVQKRKRPEIVIPKSDISEKSSIFSNEPSESVVDESLDSGLYPKDIRLKSPRTSSKVHLNAQSDQNTKSSEEYRKINIIWDRSILMKTLKEMGMTHKFKLIHALIFKVDNALKKYIKIRSDSDKLISIPPLFKNCETARSNHFDRANFRRPINLEADLLIFLVAENNNNNILASAAPCQMNEHKRVFVGRLYLNLKYLEFEFGSYYDQKSEIMTVFHEVLHILAFHPMIHSNLYDEVKRNDFDQRFLNLHRLRYLPINPLIQEGHWNPIYFGNDLMAPIERIDSALSIFTLEYLDYVSPQIKTDRSVLPNNFIFDEINDFEDFFTYKCTFAEAKAKYSAFCSPQEARKAEFSCDRSRMYKAVCGKKQLSNNCYSKESNRKYICSNPFMPKEKYKTFEKYGENSRCFDTIIGGSKRHSLCLEFEVNDVGVLIKSEGSQYQCTGKDQQVTMKTKKGGKTFMVEVLCPEPKEFQKLFELTNCKQNCYGNGFCSNGKCECFDGFDSTNNCKKKTVSSSSTRFTAAL